VVYEPAARSCVIDVLLSVIEAWDAFGMPANYIETPKSGWKSLEAQQRWLKKKAREETGYIVIASVPQERIRRHLESGMGPYVDPDTLNIARFTIGANSVMHSCDPKIYDENKAGIRDIFCSISERTDAHYGYQDERPFGLGEISLRDERINRQRRFEVEGSPHILPEVYPINYLSKQHLSMRLGRSSTTLEEWINTDSEERGEIVEFTSTLAEWAPPSGCLPEIREELFRNGLLYYYKFFVPSKRAEGAPPPSVTGFHDQSWQVPEQYYRPDLSEPWESDSEIPEMFQAEWFREHLEELQRHVK